MLASHVQDKAKRLTIAYQFAKRVTDLAPELPEGWLNLARLCEQLHFYDDAWTFYLRALGMARTDQQKAHLYTNIGALAVSEGNWPTAERYSGLALEVNPHGRKAHGNLGTALLAQRRWKEGWPEYAHIVGSEQRKLIQYSTESLWQGQKDATVIIYGEQGLGDEICFASMLPEAIQDCKKVILDCDHRLQGLFQRSFPKARVYGTRWKNALTWDPEDQKPDYSLTMGGLGSLYRNHDAAFPGTPYLTPDHERVAIWKAYFQTLGKPVIGLAWSGGMQWTGSQFRQIALEQFGPLFELDAAFVSLQYKDAGKELALFHVKHPDVDIRQFRQATLTEDYDDTAALVAALDLVVAPPTAVVHLAGALGVPCIAMNSKHPCWKFASKLLLGDSVTTIPFDRSWETTISGAAELARAHV